MQFSQQGCSLEGEGAPLIALGEQHLFQDFEVFLNLGGICNLSHRDRGFDVSPCNGVLNELFQAAFPEVSEGYDREGQLAATGEVDEELLHALNELPYYRRRPPKSLGREWADREVLPLMGQSESPIEDLLHTFCVHIAHQVAYAVDKLSLRNQQMLVTGGGRHHQFLLDQLRTQLAPFGVTIPEPADSSWVDYKEAIVFGFLGLRTLLGLSTTLARSTGAAYDVVTGSIHLPPQGGLAIFPHS